MNTEDRKKCEVSVKYLERLMSGHHPVKNTELENNDVFADDNVKRCFAFIIDILRQVGREDAEIVVGRANREDRIPLRFKPNAKETAEKMIQQRELTARELETLISENLPDLVEETISKIPVTRISNYLLDEGYLVSVADAEGKNHRQATDRGEAIGITNNLVQMDGREPFMQYRFTPKAQMFVIKHLSEINSHIKEKIQQLPPQQPQKQQEGGYV